GEGAVGAAVVAFSRTRQSAFAIDHLFALARADINVVCQSLQSMRSQPPSHSARLTRKPLPKFSIEITSGMSAERRTKAPKNGSRQPAALKLAHFHIGY